MCIRDRLKDRAEIIAGGKTKLLGNFPDAERCTFQQKMCIRDRLQTVVVGLFEVDQRECGNVQKTADDPVSYTHLLFAKNELDIAVLGNYLNLAHPDTDALHAIQEKYYEMCIRDRYLSFFK